LDPYPKKHRRFRRDVIDRLQELKQAPAEGGDAAFVRRKLEELIAAGTDRLIKETRLSKEKLGAILEDFTNRGQIERIGNAYIPAFTLKEFKDKLLAELEKYHRRYPLSPGISRARLRGHLPRTFGQREYDALLERLQEEEKITVKSDLVSLFDFSPEPKGKEKEVLDRLTELYRSGWLQPPSAKDALEKAGADSGRKDELFNYLQDSGILVKVSEDLFFHRDAYREAIGLLRRHFAGHQTLTLAQFRDQAGTSRKYAQALLEHFDQQKLTRRVEDHRVAAKLDRV